MESPKIEKELKSVNSIVEDYISGKLNEAQTVEFLRANLNEVTEFCLQVHESYKSGDKAGIIRIGMVLEEALKK